MANTRKKYPTAFKTKVALEAIRQHKTTNELTGEYSIHASQIHHWKKQALSAIPESFNSTKTKIEGNHQAEIDELHRQIGQLVAERDWLKKKSARLHL